MTIVKRYPLHVQAKIDEHREVLESYTEVLIAKLIKAGLKDADLRAAILIDPARNEILEALMDAVMSDPTRSEILEEIRVAITEDSHDD